MGICIDKLPHSCGTKDGLQVFADEETGKVNGYCFSCGTFVANPYGEEKTVDDVTLPKAKSKKEVEQELAEIEILPILDLPSRKLRAKYLEHFGIKVAVSEKDGKTPSATYFPMTKNGEVTGYYVKTLGDKKFEWSVGDVKNAEPMGWQQAKETGAYRLIITEGREDAVATLAMATMYGKAEYMPAIISLPNGVNSVKKSLTPISQDIKRLFREVIVVFDNDSAGEKATQEAMQILPGALTVTLSKKDPNECLMAGIGKATWNTISFSAATPKNSRLIRSGPKLHQDARTPTPFGELTWPFPTMNKLLRNIRYGETCYIGAGVKMGKSELVNALASHFMVEHDVPVLLAKPEEGKDDTYRRVAGKIAMKKFHDPEVQFDYAAYDKAGEVIGDKLFVIDLYQHLGWETLKVDIVAAANMGVKAVIIDPITNLTNGMNAADANVKLQEIAQDLSAMALDLDIVVFIFCHLKAHEGNVTRDARALKYKKGQYTQLGNCPHEFGGDILSSQFAGSRAMMRSCNLMIGLEGNKDPDLPEEIRNTRVISILEDRGFGNSARIPIYWNQKTTTFKEL